MAKISNKIQKKTFGDRVADVIIYLVFGIFALVCAFPIYYIFINSISNNGAVSRGEVLFWPVGVQFKNYLDILDMPDIGYAVWNSLSRTFLGTFASLMCTSFLGYAFTRHELWARKVWYRMLTLTMYFGAGLIPGFLNIKMLGLYNSYWVYIIPGLISVFNMILFKTFVESIPASLEESADLDGAGYMIKYLKIIMPLCKPIIATLCIFTAVGHWNDYMTTVYYIQDRKLYTLQFLLYDYMTQAQKLTQMLQEMNATGVGGSAIAVAANAMSTTSVKMSVAMVATIPVLCVYPFFQKYFVGGIMIGAVKG